METINVNGGEYVWADVVHNGNTIKGLVPKQPEHNIPEYLSAGMVFEDSKNRKFLLTNAGPSFGRQLTQIDDSYRLGYYNEQTCIDPSKENNETIRKSLITNKYKYLGKPTSYTLTF